MNKTNPYYWNYSEINNNLEIINKCHPKYKNNPLTFSKWETRSTKKGGGCTVTFAIHTGNRPLRGFDLKAKNILYYFLVNSNEKNNHSLQYYYLVTMRSWTNKLIKQLNQS